MPSLHWSRTSPGLTSRLRTSMPTISSWPASRGAVHLARQHFEGEAARDLAAGVAADPVGHREDEAVLMGPVADRILVLRADAADVCQLEELDLRHDGTGRRHACAAGPNLVPGARRSYATGRAAGISPRPPRMLAIATYSPLTTAHAPAIAMQM